MTVTSPRGNLFPAKLNLTTIALPHGMLSTLSGSYFRSYFFHADSPSVVHRFFVRRGFIADRRQSFAAPGTVALRAEIGGICIGDEFGGYPMPASGLVIESIRWGAFAALSVIAVRHRPQFLFL